MVKTGIGSGPMESVQELHAEVEARAEQAGGMQPCAYLLELSPDWIVRRTSENIHQLLHESHVTLIDEPLGRFVHAQALHDVRNLFSRLSGTTGIGRAYAVRLTDDHELVDIAFQLVEGRVLLEAVPSSGGFGECLGSVGGLIAGLGGSRGQPLLDSAARRMRALTGYDRVTVVYGDQRAESSRGGFDAPAGSSQQLSAIVGDSRARPVAVFPRGGDDRSLANALLRACDADALDRLQAEGVRASITVSFTVGDRAGQFRCDSRAPQKPCFEMHAAAELFAQMFAMRLELDGTRA
jgi:light-regulated signal transduction histidine kinase (bacteriophytochrome)